jgi:formamidopyrimidine-DNA glycosylase
MPELPEVQTVVSQLNQSIVGARIAAISFNEGKILRPTPEQFIGVSQGQTITTVTRKGKWIVLELNNGYSITIHLKLSGQLLLRWPHEEKDKYLQVLITLQYPNATQRELRFCEVRKFGYMQILGDAEGFFEQKIGPDFKNELTFGQFRQRVTRRKMRIKQLLMDQNIFAGIGNIYANDALWLAQIHPETLANRLTTDQLALLWKNLNKVVNEGIRKGGASDQWFKDIYGNMGNYQKNFKVYGQQGKSCQRCFTAIEYYQLAGRGTFFCPVCQPTTL